MNGTKSYRWSWGNSIFNKGVNKMTKAFKFNEESMATLYEYLTKFDRLQLKQFYNILVYYWLNFRYFISSRSFYSLWCKFNDICAKKNKEFPNPYKDINELKRYCQEHPYYFIDMIPPRTVSRLFFQHLDDKIDILAGVAERIYTKDMRSVFEYLKETFSLNGDVDEMIKVSEKQIVESK